MTDYRDPCVLENLHTGERLALRRVWRANDVWLEMKGSLPAGRPGPPLHIHHDQIEEGRVMSGTLAAEIDGQAIVVPMGKLAHFPAGSAHRWWNAGKDTLIFEGFARPALDLDRYLQAAFDVINNSPAERPSLFFMAHLAWRHRHTQTVLLAPRWLQGVILPLIVLTGTLLGKYRGTDWPGCPARFTPAPLARRVQRAKLAYPI